MPPPPKQPDDVSERATPQPPEPEDDRIPQHVGLTHTADIDLAAHAHVTTALERWNRPRVNAYRYLSTLFGFVVMGMNDAAYGALIPYLEKYYHLNYTVVSLIFLTPFMGYTAAALLTNQIHMRWGQRGVALIAPLCKLTAYVATSTHPPYPVLAVVYMLAGMGIGLQDGAWSAWLGNMHNANELLGLLHGCYGLGATISPLIATTMIIKGHLPWYYFYYLMVAMAALEFVLCFSAFYRATGAVYREADAAHQGSGTSRTKEALSNSTTWICAFFLLCYVGTEVSVGGWIVTFMLKVRHGQAFQSGLVGTGFWLGLTCGRVILGFVTGKLGEKVAIASYLVACMVVEICFWLVPNFIASAVFAAWLGFFLGPIFPSAIVVATKLLPRRLHVSAIGFAAAFGGGGAAILPFVVGAIAQKRGVAVLQPIVLSLLVVILALWASFPGGFRKGGLEPEGDGLEGPASGAVERRWIDRRLGRLTQRLGFRD